MTEEFKILSSDWSDSFLLDCIKELKQDIEVLARMEEDTTEMVSLKMEQLDWLITVRTNRGL